MKFGGFQQIVLLSIITLFAAMSGSGESAALTLPSVFSNNMVIQRDKQIHIWGQASPQEQIRVEFAGQSATTVAKSDAWEVWLDPVAAGGPYELVVAGEGRHKTFQNILVGDVWIASGQSNMVTTLQAVTSGADVTSRAHLQEAVKLANSPIRLFQPAIVSSEQPLADYTSGSWSVGSFVAAYPFSAVGFFFGAYLQQSLGIPIGIMQLAKGGSPAQAWMSSDAYQTSTALRQIQIMTEGFEKDRSNKPSALYNGMIAPAHDFPVKGVIWYQGERNAGAYKPADYSSLMTALINDWRLKWRDQLPFLIVQLPAFGTNDTTWPELRDEQRKIALTNENVGLAVTIDTGDRNDIHPKNKMPVGYRLALQARCLVYKEDVVCSGPTFERAEIWGDEVALSFGNTGGGLTSLGRPLTGFRLCSANRQCATAEAEIQGQQVVLWSNEIDRPTAVSYAWSDFPEVSLFNAEGLPAAPFYAEVNQASPSSTGSGKPSIMVTGYPVVNGSRVNPLVLVGATPIEVFGLPPDAKVAVTLQALGSGVAGLATAGEVAPALAPLFSLTAALNQQLFDTRQVADGVYDLTFMVSDLSESSRTLKTRVAICNSTSLENHLPQLLGSSSATSLSRVVLQGQPLGHVRLTRPLSGSLVAGDMPIEYSGAHSMVVKQLDVTLVPAYDAQSTGEGARQMLLYSGSTLPDRLVVDTTKFADGGYDLVFSITLIDGKTTSIKHRIAIRNWTLLEDAVEPPMSGGWFGDMVRMKTTQATTGWEFTGSPDDALFGDADRIRRKAATEESLTWELPRLHDFAFTVYSRNPELAQAVQVMLSSDGKAWASANYSTKVLERSDTGWWKISIEGDVKLSMLAEQIRFTIFGKGVAPADLELGHVELRGVASL